MDKEQILDYVMHTPANTNRAVLEGMIDILLNDFFIEKIRETITKAEASGLQFDKDASMSLVISLPDGEEKTELEQRLAILQESINTISAANAVLIAEQEPNMENLELAHVLVNLLMQGEDKSALESRLAVVEETIKIIAATEAVELAEASQPEGGIENRPLYDTALSLVSALQDGASKTVLMNRLGNIDYVG